MSTVISVEHLSKTYRLGQIGTGTFSRDLELWWAKVRGKPNPMLRIGEKDHGNRNGEELWALRDVSFTVEQGEVLGIIGRNGAGKSTLVKILSRVTAPTSGRIKVKGRIASLLEVGTGFHPELTGRENIYLNGAILGMSKSEVTRKFDEIVDFSEVEKFIDTPVKRYSSGMYVRLAFAVAAHLDPEVLAVDEVLAVGDAEFQKKCLGKMGSVAKEGRTVLFVSHNMTAIKSLCPNSILLSKGQLTDRGDSNGIVINYLKNSTLQTIERTWADPQHALGNDKVRFKSARVTHDFPTGFIDVSTPIDLEFEIWNYLDYGDLNFSLVLYTNEEVCVLNTTSKLVSCSSGLIKGICHIPGNFLNDAVYRVRILIVKDSSRGVFDDANILSFEVVEGERIGGWHGKWVGVVRPKFDWDVELK